MTPSPPKKNPTKPQKTKTRTNKQQKPHHPTNQQTNEPTYPLPLKNPQIIQKQIKGSFMYVIMIKLLQKISIDRHLIRMRLQKKINDAPILHRQIPKLMLLKIQPIYLTDRNHPKFMKQIPTKHCLSKKLYAEAACSNRCIIGIPRARNESFFY